jgi:hypothetical protein
MIIIGKGPPSILLKASRTRNNSIWRKYDKEIGRVLYHTLGPGVGFKLEDCSPHPPPQSPEY